MIQILFVCLGNICRSPIAEGVFKEMVAKKGLDKWITCDSAGTAAYHVGSLPDKRMRKVASERGISLTHTARSLCLDDFTRFDYIMAMDEANFAAIREASFEGMGQYLPEDQLYLYRLFDPLREKALRVPDPYYGEIHDFVEVYQIVERSGAQFLEYLIEKHQLIVDSED